MPSATYILLLLLELVVATILLHQLILRGFPFVMYAIAKKATVKNFNQLRYFDLPTPQSKTKMPSPEIRYSIGFYDVRKRNVRIHGDMPTDTYWSIALHTNNSINFLTKNDQHYSVKKINMLLVNADNKEGFSSGGDNMEIIQAPSPKGIVVLRILQPNYRNDAPTRFQDIQQSIKMEVI